MRSCSRCSCSCLLTTEKHSKVVYCITSLRQRTLLEDIALRGGGVRGELVRVSGTKYKFQLDMATSVESFVESFGLFFLHKFVKRTCSVNQSEYLHWVQS